LDYDSKVFHDTSLSFSTGHPPHISENEVDKGHHKLLKAGENTRIDLQVGNITVRRGAYDGAVCDILRWPVWPKLPRSPHK